MRNYNDRNDLIRQLIQNNDSQFSNEEQLHQLIDEKMSVNLNADDSHLTFGQRAADAIARFAGSWAFIITFTLITLLWIYLNILMASGAFDPYPFILLNLVLSCLAAVQAPLIMMSQNRQEDKDRARAENDYKVNLKNELVIDDLHDKLDQVLANQADLNARLDALGAPAPAEKKQ